MKRKILISTFFLTGMAVISSCSESHNSQELKILHDCNGNICGIELGVVDKTVRTDILGKEHVLNKSIVKSTDSSLVWSGINNFTTNTQLIKSGLSARCAIDQCDNSDNPTGGVFTSGQAVNISVNGTIVVNGEIIRLTDFSSGGNLIVPTYATSVVYVCPEGVTDSNSYGLTDGVTWTAPSSRISVIKTGSGSNCSMQFTCPAGYAMANNAISVGQGSTLIGGNIDSTVKPLFEAGSGDLKVLRFYIQFGEGKVFEEGSGRWGSSFAYYANAQTSPQKLTFVSCAPIS